MKDAGAFWQWRQGRVAGYINLDTKCFTATEVVVTKLSLDGSGVGIGGHPADVIQIGEQFRMWTDTIKYSCSKTLICSSNSAGKVLPSVIYSLQILNMKVTVGSIIYGF